ncbi:MAG: ATP-binding protein [Treponema sp.]|jgi:predicted AAA+ superfamily ATPase|nr:ATP-binding protein [Treponema sp.]
MPLLLFGARQTGKTYILNEFGERHFGNTVYVNLETNLSVAEYFSADISPDRIIRFLETTVRSAIRPGETLVILDEIQSCERALTSLKYFCEQAPEYHVAAAGSLLGVAVNRETYSFPVGKVENFTLYPLDFEEFLWACGEEALADEIRRCFRSLNPLPEALHLRAVELYRCYLIVGGMPACVEAFARGVSLPLIPAIQNNILDNYVADMAKYAGKTGTVKIRACFNAIPAQLAKENRKFQYRVVQRGGSVSLFGPSIEWLAQAGVALKCQKTEQAINPIAVYADLSSFKLYMGDVGLLVMKSALAQQTILSGGGNTFMGAVTENYIAQALTAAAYPLFYWTSDYLAEIDFVAQKGRDIIGIEVKKGVKTHSKSLRQFISKYKPALAIRFSEKNFGRNVVDQDETRVSVLALPHYAAFCLGEL